ncbi:Cytochrome c3 family protein [Desulfarculales bacterium]
MKHIKPSLALLLVGALCVPLAALAQDDLMSLNSKAMGPHERPLVVFTHNKHSANIECQTCHHDFDQYFNHKSSEGLLCSECHKVVPDAKNKVSLTTAFHKQCKDCHNKAAIKGNPKGPVMCGDCHVNTERLPEVRSKAKSMAKPKDK